MPQASSPPTLRCSLPSRTVLGGMSQQVCQPPRAVLLLPVPLALPCLMNRTGKSPCTLVRPCECMWKALCVTPCPIEVQILSHGVAWHSACMHSQGGQSTLRMIFCVPVPCTSHQETLCCSRFAVLVPNMVANHQPICIWSCTCLSCFTKSSFACRRDVPTAAPRLPC